MIKQQNIRWADPQFNGFRKWLNENYDISLIPNKNTFLVQSPGEYTPTMPVGQGKVFFYARIYYTDSSNTKPHNNVPNYDSDYLTWWYAGQALWLEIKSCYWHDDITDLYYLVGDDGLKTR